MKQPAPDPIAAFSRKQRITRRNGTNAGCSCGESDPTALVAGGLCEECKRGQKGHSVMDQHHVAGRANSSKTVPIPANDHRKILSEAQRDWPRSTLENSDGCPLRAAAACIRGFVDTLCYLVDSFLQWIAGMLELASEVLLTKLGRKWWMHTDLKQFAPKGKKCSK